MNHVAFFCILPLLLVVTRFDEWEMWESILWVVLPWVGYYFFVRSFSGCEECNKLIFNQGTLFQPSKFCPFCGNETHRI